MWQRVQTLYYSLAAIVLSTLLFGIELFGFRGESYYYRFSVYGFETLQLKKNFDDEQLVELWNIPFYIVVISLILLIVMTALSYKNLARQFKMARILFFIYLLLVVALVAYAMIGIDVNEPVKRELGLGFLLFIVAFPFTFLGQIGIKRDKKLLDSLDRLR